MPNGRTDIFEVKKEDFLFSLRALKENEEIGITFGQPMKQVYLSELEERALEHEGENIEIEEQREEYYIIRVGNDFYKWVAVMREHQLFLQIKQLHLSQRSV